MRRDAQTENETESEEVIQHFWITRKRDSTFEITGKQKWIWEICQNLNLGNYLKQIIANVFILGGGASRYRDPGIGHPSCQSHRCPVQTGWSGQGGGSIF